MKLIYHPERHDEFYQMVNSAIRRNIARYRNALKCMQHHSELLAAYNNLPWYKKLFNIRLEEPLYDMFENQCFGLKRQFKDLLYIRMVMQKRIPFEINEKQTKLLIERD